MRLFPLLLAGFLLSSLSIFAQNAPQHADFNVHIAKNASAVKLDGVLDDAVWQTAETITDFYRDFPTDTGLAVHQTRIQLSFDDHFLYVAATCYERREDYTVQSLKRDFQPGTSDAINVLISPFKDGLNGFLFSVSPLNVQREAMIDNGANSSYEWDNKWYSEVQNYDEYWTAEFAIPFKTLRYSVSAGENSWHVNFVRTWLKEWEISSWYPVKRQFPTNNLAFVGTMIWAEPPPKPGANISFIPYLTTGYSVDYLRNSNTLDLQSKPGKWVKNIGGDAKIGITPSLNLDLTINPDFSQVEVDRQVANLSRFELFFPERRQFFLENRDLFAMFGFPSTRPFFSRRIGLAYNPVTGFNQKVPILAGARLSGKLNDNWRVGVLNMQTERIDWDTTQTLPAANFTVATLQRKIFGRSAISAILVNKQNFTGKLSDRQKEGFQPWNRVAGLEYNLYSKDNRWEGEWYYHRSFSPDPQQRGATLAGFLGFNDRHFNANMGYMRVDSFYTAEAGFVPRTAIQSMFPGIGWRFIPPDGGRINTLALNLSSDLTLNLKGDLYDRNTRLSLNTSFKNQAGCELGLNNSYTYLFEPFDPTNLYEDGTQPLPAGDYSYNSVSLDYWSSTSYNLQGMASVSAGQFFNGDLISFDGELSYRWQPHGTFGVAYSYNRIHLPAPYASASIWLLGPRAELSFSRNLFASAFFQYNTQANNFNINTRLQWRFAPASDIFLVYTDNSFAQPIEHTPVRFLTPKNKAVVLKVVYWLNV